MAANNFLKRVTRGFVSDDSNFSKDRQGFRLEAYRVRSNEGSAICSDAVGAVRPTPVALFKDCPEMTNRRPSVA